MGLAELFTSDPAADARNRLDAAEQTADRCRAELRERRRRLSEAVDANRVDLDAENLAEQVDGAGTEAMRIATQIEAVEDACRRADARVVNTRRAVLEAHADRLEADASDLRKEADRHQSKVDKLLSKLEDLDGAKYIPWSPMAQGMTPQEYALHFGPFEWTQPRAERLNAEANEAERRARTIRQRAATVDLTDAAAFEAAVAAANPDSPEAHARRDRVQAAQSHAEAVREAWKEGRQAVYQRAYDDALTEGKNEGKAANYGTRARNHVPAEPVANWTRPIAQLDPDEVRRAFEQADDPGDVFEALHGPTPTASQLRRARAS